MIFQAFFLTCSGQHQFDNRVSTFEYENEKPNIEKGSPQTSEQNVSQLFPMRSMAAMLSVRARRCTLSLKKFTELHFLPDDKVYRKAVECGASLVQTAQGINTVVTSRSHSPESQPHQPEVPSPVLCGALHELSIQSYTGSGFEPWVEKSGEVWMQKHG